MRIRPTGAPVYRLKVSLRGLRPQVWRRFVVPSNITLKRLHDSLQAVMPWTNSHMHQFEAGGVLYGTSERGVPDFGLKLVSENRTLLDSVLRKPKDRMMYEYDFGDGWEHDIVLEAILPNEPGASFPFVEAGKRACPPEDIGGVPCYTFLEVLKDPTHPEYADRLEWLGGKFDPEAFSAGRANLDIRGGWVRDEPDA